jgi:hypothetical protein
MHELRLAVCGSDEAGCAGIAARLRGAVVEPCDLTRFGGPPDGYDALILTRLWPPSLAEVDRLLAKGAHILIGADPCPPGDVLAGLFRFGAMAGIQLAVVNPDRYLPSRQLVRRQMAAVGEAGLIRLHRWAPAEGSHASDLTERPEPVLRDLDVTLWLAGRRPDRAFATEHKAVGTTGRYLQVHLGFPGGGMVLLDYASTLPPGDGYSSLSVIARSGAAYADDHQNAQLLYRGGRPQAVRTEERAGQLAAIAQEFVDALREKRDVMAASEAAWRDVFAVTDAVVKSLKSGRAVEVEGR